jgi:hypothetical protein
MDELLMTIFAAVKMAGELEASHAEEAGALKEAGELLQRAFAIIRDSGAKKNGRRTSASADTSARGKRGFS